MASLQRHPCLTTIKELQGFLGVVNFYRLFMPGAARVLWPLTNTLRSGNKPGAPVFWSEDMQRTFQGAKDSLAVAKLLAHPTTRAELALVVDASPEHVGAAL